MSTADQKVALWSASQLLAREVFGVDGAELLHAWVSVALAASRWPAMVSVPRPIQFSGEGSREVTSALLTGLLAADCSAAVALPEWITKGGALPARLPAVVALVDHGVELDADLVNALAIRTAVLVVDHAPEELHVVASFCPSINPARLEDLVLLESLGWPTRPR